MPHTRDELLAAATSFCEAFASQQPPEAILSHFSGGPDSDSDSDTPGAAVVQDKDILVYEHGLPQLAPFLGREFRGRAGAREYLATIARCISYEDMRFVEYVVDTTAAEGEKGVQGKVAARGTARFTWKSTGQAWHEVFTYVLAFDAARKVRSYEIWADSGAAYLASRGEL